MPIKICLSIKAKTEEAKHYQSKSLEKLIFANLEQFLEHKFESTLQLMLKILVFQSCHSQPEHILQILEINY